MLHAWEGLKKQYNVPMNIPAIRDRDFEREWIITASRSSGAGGQNVNKVNTKIELRFSIPDSALLSEREKQLLLSRLAHRLVRNGELIITAQSERTQLKNKNEAIARFYALLQRALQPVKKRVPTRPTKASRLRRLESKRQQAEKKNRRREN
jgi:ribosome-associated protein